MVEFRKIVDKLKSLSLSLLLVIILFIISAGVFYYISTEAVIEKESGFDTFVFNKLAAITNPSVTEVMSFITFFGSTNFLLPAYLLLSAYWLFFKRDTRRAISVSAIGLISAAVLRIVKDIFQRPRPLHPLLSAGPHPFLHRYQIQLQ